MKNSKPTSYYNEYIEVVQKALNRTEEKLNMGSIPDNRVHLAKFRCISGKLKLLIAKYSKGDSKELLRSEYLLILNDIQDLWDSEAVLLKDNKGNPYDLYILDSYFYMRWLLSLGILFEINDSDFKILVELIDRDNIKDSLYDFLIHSHFKDRIISKNLALKEPKNDIVNILNVEDRTECELFLKRYLEKDWHKTYKNFNAFNSHNKPDDMYLFYGCWAFEVTALVKIKRLNDSAFRDNKYYPERLL